MAENPFDDLPKVYIDSDLRKHIITDMPNGYLHSALAKLMRLHPTRTHEIENMTAEAVKRANAEDYATAPSPNLVVRRQQMRASPWVSRLAEPLAKLQAVLDERGVR